MPARSRANKQAVLGRNADGMQPPTVLCFHFSFHRCNASGNREVMTLKQITGLSVKQITVSSHWFVAFKNGPFPFSLTDQIYNWAQPKWFRWGACLGPGFPRQFHPSSFISNSADLLKPQGAPFPSPLTQWVKARPAQRHSQSVQQITQNGAIALSLKSSYGNRNGT